MQSHDSMRFCASKSTNRYKELCIFQKKQHINRDTKPWWLAELVWSPLKNSVALTSSHLIRHQDACAASLPALHLNPMRQGVGAGMRAIKWVTQKWGQGGLELYQDLPSGRMSCPSSLTWAEKEAVAAGSCSHSRPFQMNAVLVSLFYSVLFS